MLDNLLDFAKMPSIERGVLTLSLVLPLLSARRRCVHDSLAFRRGHYRSRACKLVSLIPVGIFDVRISNRLDAGCQPLLKWLCNEVAICREPCSERCLEVSCARGCTRFGSGYVEIICRVVLLGLGGDGDL